MSRTITEEDLKNILNEILPSVAVDYVVEEGTEGIWTYRKWNSGIAECWGSERKDTTVASSWGNGYVSQQLSASFPSGLFIETPTSVSIFITGAFTAIAENSNSISSSAITYSLFRPSAVTSSQDYYARIHAIGKWK